MYINPVIAGVLGTLFVEIVVFVLVSLLLAYYDSKGEDENGKDNDY